MKASDYWKAQADELLGKKKNEDPKPKLRPGEPHYSKYVKKNIHFKFKAKPNHLKIRFFFSNIFA